jgi:hypothetical protein
MSIAALPQQALPSPIAGGGDAAERQQFCTLLWGDTAGWVEVVAGLDAPALVQRGWLRPDERATDPDIKMLAMTRPSFDADKASGRPHTRKLFRWPAEAAKLDAYAQRLAEAYGNVYTCVSPYAYRSAGDGTPSYTVTDALPTKPGNKLAGPLPSRVLLVEDAPAHPPHPYSFCVETSRNSRHGYYLLTAPLASAALARLGQGAARMLGADASGFDREQRIRIPTTRNTKPKNGAAGASVRLVVSNGPTYPVELLARAFLPKGMAELGSAEASPRRHSTGSAGRAVGTGDEPWRDPEWRDALDKEAEPWRPLMRTGRGGLLADNGIPRGLQPHQPGYQILVNRQQGKYTYFSPNGNWDASRERKDVMLSLMYIGYTNGQIAAMAEKLANFGEEGGFKSTDDIWLDICRLICKYSDKLGEKRRIRTPGAAVADATTVAERPHTPRASRGKCRPRVSVDAAQLLGFYTLRAVEGAYTSTCKADAYALGISVATLNRLDSALKERGVISIAREGNGRLVTLQGCVKNAAQVAAEMPAQGCVIRAVEGIETPNDAGAASRESTPRPLPPPTPGGDTSAGAPIAAAGVLSHSPQEAAPPQDIDISRERGTPTEHRMTSVYLAQGEQVASIASDANARRAKRGDLRRTLPSGQVRYTEVKGEKAYPSGCVAVEYETIPVAGVAYGGPSGPAESTADTVVYMVTTDGRWWEHETATIRARLQKWLAAARAGIDGYRIINGPINKRQTPHGYAEYHTRCVLVPQRDYAQDAVASGIAPTYNPLAEAVRDAFDVIPRLYVDPTTGALGKVTLKRVRLELERQGCTYSDARLATAYANEQKRRKPKPWEAAQAEARAIVSDDELRAASARAASNYTRLQREAAPSFVAEKVAKAEEYNRLDASVSGRKGGRRQPKDLAQVRAAAEVTHRQARRKVNNARWRAEALGAEVARRTTPAQIAAEDAQIAAQVAWAQQRAIDGPRERAEAVANHQRFERQDVAAVVELGASPAQRRADVPNGAQECSDTTPASQRGAGESYDIFAAVGERLRQGLGVRFVSSGD